MCPQFPAGTATAACAPGAASWEAARLGVQLPGTAFATLGERIKAARALCELRCLCDETLEIVDRLWGRGASIARRVCSMAA